MTGIWDFPALEELREFIDEGIETTRQGVLEEVEGEREEILERISLERQVVVGEWSRGTAEIGDDPLRMFLFFSMEDEPQPQFNPQFDNAVRITVQGFITRINQGELVPPEPSMEWFPLFDPQPISIDNFEDQISLSLGRREGNRVFDLTRMEAIEFREGVDFRDLPRIPGEQLVEEEEEPEEEPEEEVEPEPEPEPVPPPEPEVIPTEEKVRSALEQFSIDGEAEIPAGKPTKRVEIRDFYDFELLMGLPTNAIREIDMSPADQLTNGIGFAAELGRLGTTAPPANFPRTSSYIKNRLTFQGTAYVLEMYNDLVIYTGLIRSFYDIDVKPGSYRSFREFIYRLKEVGERGGPELVRSLSQQQAAARGLKTIPDHPTIEGENAPWLENRNYYEIVEENSDHEAWDNVTEFLYGVPE